LSYAGQIAERGSDGEVVGCSARDEQPHHVVVDRRPPIAPNGEVDRLQIVWVPRVYVRATIEQKSHHLTPVAQNGTVERRDAPAGAPIHKRGVGVEQRPDGVDLAKRRGSMNRVVGCLRHDSSAALSFLFEHPRDRLVAALSRHFDQVAIIQAVLFGIRACVEQEAHRFDVSFARRKMHGGCVPVSRSSETRITLEEPLQCRDVAGRCGDDGVPCVAAVRGFQVDGFDHRTPPGWPA